MTEKNEIKLADEISLILNVIQKDIFKLLLIKAVNNRDDVDDVDEAIKDKLIDNLSYNIAHLINKSCVAINNISKEENKDYLFYKSIIARSSN